MGARMPPGQPSQLPQPELQQPGQQDPSAIPVEGDENQMAQLVTGVSDGLTAIAEVMMNVSPQHGQRMGNVLEEFQAIMLELSGGGEPQQPPVAPQEPQQPLPPA